MKHVNLAAIVTSSDSGGSAGELRDEFGILPPWDIRRAIAALSRDTEMVRQLFEHRFKKSRVQGHTIGNLLLTWLAEMTGSFEEGIEILCKMFDVEGKVVPVTLDTVDLAVTLEDGSKIHGETNIDIPKHDGNLRIIQAELIGKNTLNPTARQIIENSDYIILWPGDLYTSIIPNLLVNGMKEALQNTPATVLYICNIMTKHGETNNFWAIEFIDVLEKYIGRSTIDFVILNNGEIREELKQKYKETENKMPVILSDIHAFQKRGYRVIERDMTSDTDFARHDPKKLGNVISDFIHQWIR